jgi:hypothetical protein
MKLYRVYFGRMMKVKLLQNNRLNKKKNNHKIPLVICNLKLNFMIKLILKTIFSIKIFKKNINFSKLLNVQLK